MGNGPKADERDGEAAEKAAVRSLEPPVWVLRRALRNTEIMILIEGRDFRYQWAENPRSVWNRADLAGKADADLLPEADASRLREAKDLVLETGETARIEIQVRLHSDVTWFDLWVDLDDKTGGLVTTAVDITEQKRREQTLRALLREVSHRSKNLLAIIQSIATQTGRFSGSISEFLTDFYGRIHSLAASQDLVTSSNWRGAHFSELVYEQVGRYAAQPKRNIRLVGENPHLNPNAALHIGLALHELAVNSVAYGALRQREGYVVISAARLPRPERDALVLTWSEEVGPGEESRLVRRFGSIALERVVPAALGGEATLKLTDGHLEYTLTAPGDSFEWD